MIDVKQAVQIAKEKAADILEKPSAALEEVERESYNGREVWSITLSLPRDVNQMPGLTRLYAEPISYKRFILDAQTGELVAIRLREIASR